MAASRLTVCKDCNKEISKKAKICPGCGAKNKQPSLIVNGFLIFLAVMFVIGAINGGGKGPSHGTISTQATTTPPSAAVATEPSAGSPWNIQESTSDMDGSKYVILATDGTEVNYSSYQRFTPVLLIRCKENKTEMILDVGKMINPEHDEDFNSYAEARIRYDEDKAFRVTTSISTDHNAFFFNQPVAATKKMFDRKTMLFEFQPYSMGNFTTTFNIEGLKDKIAPLRTACGW